MRGLAKGSEAWADPHGLHLPPVPKARARFLETEEARGGVGSKDVPVKHQKRSQTPHSLCFSNTQLFSLLL